MITARVLGQPFAQFPDDLYIPPDALEVFLETFEGPLDLLLYLIRKQNLDILDIPIAKITAQYLEYIELMQVIRFELAAEYLLMAAMLAEIKSRLLLPRSAETDIDEEHDPRAELVRRLQEYEQFKKAAEDVDQLPRWERDLFPVHVDLPDFECLKPQPDVTFDELMASLRDVLRRAENNAHHHIQREPLSIRERMMQVLERIKPDGFTLFPELFSLSEGRMGVVVTFIAILELVKQAMIELTQNEPFSPIYVKAVAAGGDIGEWNGTTED